MRRRCFRWALTPLLTVLALAAPAEPYLQSGAIEINAQEWRDTPQRHLYIHGTLNGDTDFRILMPEKDVWQGRILQYLQGGLGGGENVGSFIQHDTFALANGAVYVESNQGHRGTAAYEDDDTWQEIAYEASHAVVQYAQIRCVERYARSADYVYVTGDSGGGHRATGLLERFPRLYDGAVPCVAAGVFQVPWYLFSVLEQTRPVLQAKREQFEAAFKPGGSRDPWEIVGTDEEKRALRRLLFAGFPMPMLGALRNEATSMIILDYAKYKLDPTYFDDFWSKPGYAGHAGEVAESIVEGIEGEILELGAQRRRFRAALNPAPPGVYGMTLTFTSGKLAGEWRRITGQPQGQLEVGGVGPGIDGAEVGDRFVLDNRDLIAFRHLHLHLRDPEDRALAGLPEDHEQAWAQRDPMVAAGIFEPDRPEGQIQGKVIAIYGTKDTLVWPTNAFRYARRVSQHHGAATEDHFRLHFVENGVHHPMPQQDLNEFVGRLPLVHKALEDLMAWVETNSAPVPGTTFTIDEMNQLHLAPTAEERGGYQPVVSITAQDQNESLEGKQHQEILFRVSAADPDNTLALCEIDFEGDGTFDTQQPVEGKEIELVFRHAYDAPGTFYPTVRVTDSTQGLAENGIQNLASMRVVIRP